MGKNLRQQARGTGSPRYRSPAHRFLGEVNYSQIPDGASSGMIVDILDAPGRTSPVSVIDFSGKRILQIAHEGASVGQKIDFEAPNNGNILELRNVPEGTKIYNIELHPGDGGKICRSSGCFATITGKEKNKCTILLPSKQKKILPLRCRATIGVVSGAGRTEKPFMKAGTKWYAMRAVNRYYPHVSGVSMNAVDHPFGGKAKPGKHKTVSRNMPPGKKVGSISARRMGKKKRKA
ncbi:MAG: 50S ribosomal protein L2 [Candidatus Aenigmatarchaeota archaeon]